MANNKIRSSTDERPFFMVYQDFIKSDRLDTSEQKLLFITLKSFANSKNKCFPSFQKLASITKLSKRKVQSTLKELESKRVIKVEKRLREDGGLSSNLYTLYDFKEMWSTDSDEKLAETIDQYEEERMIELLKLKGYSVIKEKGLASAPTKVTDTSSLNSLNCINHYSQTTLKCQGGTPDIYELEDLKDLMDYNIIINDHPALKDKVDVVFNILLDTLNTTKETIRINREDKPSQIVKDKLLKLTSSHIIYAIKKYEDQTERINNPEGYIITILYKANEQMHLDIENQVNYDQTHKDK